VTTKEALHELVEALSDDDAQELLRLAEETFVPDPLTDDDRAAIARGLEDVRSGRFVSTDEVRRRFNLPE
jgi:predicted transcriptional regulator